jgi:hypothetical protein
MEVSGLLGRHGQGALPFALDGGHHFRVFPGELNQALDVGRLESWQHHHHATVAHHGDGGEIGQRVVA